MGNFVSVSNWGEETPIETVENVQENEPTVEQNIVDVESLPNNINIKTNRNRNRNATAANRKKNNKKIVAINEPEAEMVSTVPESVTTNDPTQNLPEPTPISNEPPITNEPKVVEPDGDSEAESEPMVVGGAYKKAHKKRRTRKSKRKTSH
jgi:hypothetical protein